MYSTPNKKPLKSYQAEPKDNFVPSKKDAKKCPYFGIFIIFI